jgi:hypothetical protein
MILYYTIYCTIYIILYTVYIIILYIFYIYFSSSKKFFLSLFYFLDREVVVEVVD